MKAYLLGAIPDDKAAELEEKYFTDPAFLNFVRSIEKTLIDDYLENRLSPSDRLCFESRYLEVPELKRRLEEVRDQRLPADRIRRSNTSLLLRWALAGVALCAILLGAWLYRHRTSVSPPIMARTNLPELAAFNFRLTPGVVKSFGAKPVEFAIPENAGPVNLTLELPGPGAPQSDSPMNCLVRISTVDTNGRLNLIWAAQPVRSQSIKSGTEITIELQASVLNPADYIVELTTPAGAILETYMFRVNAPPRR